MCNIKYMEEVNLSLIDGALLYTGTTALRNGERNAPGF